MRHFSWFLPHSLTFFFTLETAVGDRIHSFVFVCLDVICKQHSFEAQHAPLLRPAKLECCALCKSNTYIVSSWSRSLSICNFFSVIFLRVVWLVLVRRRTFQSRRMSLVRRFNRILLPQHMENDAFPIFVQPMGNFDET